ncbi:MAG: bacteriohemerythrin [Elusimicrobiales bacterium]|nr:bacteriohemerythrin [Elusimicrobiales bacterium]
MNLINWNESLSVGIDKFDQEHKKLVSLINHLNLAMSQGKSKDILGGIISELIKYSQTHFKNEEDFFKEINFNESQSHINSHKAFVIKVGDFESRFKRGQIGLSVDIINFLKEWLTKHIQVEDKKYGEFAKSKNIIG